MKSIEAKSTRVIVARIYPDEDIIDSIIKLVRDRDLKSGLINVIGAVKKTTIGFFDLRTKKYTFKTIEEDLELLSCMGNLSFRDGEPVVHLHVNLGKSDFSVIGGHLSQPTIISVTGEVYIYEVDKKFLRAVDPQIGLALLDLK